LGLHVAEIWLHFRNIYCLGGVTWFHKRSFPFPFCVSSYFLILHSCISHLFIFRFSPSPQICFIMGQRASRQSQLLFFSSLFFHILGFSLYFLGAVVCFSPFVLISFVRASLLLVRDSISFYNHDGFWAGSFSGLVYVHSISS
jgi:hypothetical protein